MNNNLAQQIEQRPDGFWYICDDWYPAPLPVNLIADDMAYLDTSYSFSCFQSEQAAGFRIGYASGNYLHSNFITGTKGKINIGKYVILETTSLIANEEITIKDHCMLSWNSVVTDSWIDKRIHNPNRRKEILRNGALSEARTPVIPNTKPVMIEKNVWVGFGAVILPGVTLGENSIIGCNTIVDRDVPPGAVVAGNPFRIIRYLKTKESDENLSEI